MKRTAHMELSIEEQKEVRVGHGKLALKMGQRQNYVYHRYGHKRFLYQKLLQQSSKTDGTQELFELLLKQPHEMKHFSAINPFDEDSEALVPALIFPQRSETMLSYIRYIDGLLSLSDLSSEVCVQYTWVDVIMMMHYHCLA